MKKYKNIFNCCLFLVTAMIINSHNLQACSPGGHVRIFNNTDEDVTVEYALMLGKSNSKAKDNTNYLKDQKSITIQKRVPLKKCKKKECWKHSSASICWKHNAKTKKGKEKLSLGVIKIQSSNGKELICTANVTGDALEADGSLDCHYDRNIQDKSVLRLERKGGNTCLGTGNVFRIPTCRVMLSDKQFPQIPDSFDSDME